MKSFAITVKQNEVATMLAVLLAGLAATNNAVESITVSFHSEDAMIAVYLKS